MGHFLKTIAPIAELAGSVAFPELAPVIAGGGSLLTGQGIGKSLSNAALAFGGQEIGGALGNQFPETFGSTFGTGGNSLTDLLGTTSGAGSFFGPGTIGGDVSGLLNGSGGTGSSLSSLLNGGSSSTDPLSGSVAKDTLTNGLQSGTGLSPGSSNAPLYNIGGGGSSSFAPSSGDITDQLSQGLSAGTGYTPGVPSLTAGSSFAPASPILPGASPVASSSSGGIGSLLSKYGLPLAGAAASLGSNLAAQSELTKATNAANAQLSPYLQTGGAAEGQIGSYLGLPGSAGTGGNASSILAASPGYQFTQDQGNLALQRQAAAGGTLGSGAALKAAEQFGTGLADQTGQQYLSNLQTTAGQGLGAAGQFGTNTTALGTAKGTADIATGNTLSQLLSGVGGKRVVSYNPTTGQPIYG